MDDLTGEVRDCMHDRSAGYSWTMTGHWKDTVQFTALPSSGIAECA